MNREQWLKKREDANIRTLLTTLATVATGNLAALDRPRGMAAWPGQALAKHAEVVSATGWTTMSKPRALPSRMA